MQNKPDITALSEAMLWLKRNVMEMKQWQRAYERNGCSQSFIAGLHYAMLARENDARIMEIINAKL